MSRFGGNTNDNVNNNRFAYNPFQHEIHFQLWHLNNVYKKIEYHQLYHQN